jgi:hypothetical protein
MGTVAATEDNAGSNVIASTAAQPDTNPVRHVPPISVNQRPAVCFTNHLSPFDHFLIGGGRLRCAPSGDQDRP